MVKRLFDADEVLYHIRDEAQEGIEKIKVLRDTTFNLLQTCNDPIVLKQLDLTIRMHALYLDILRRTVNLSDDTEEEDD